MLSDLLPALFPTLLRGFTDNVEKVREKSAELVNDLLARSTDPPSLLPSLMPALKATCGVVPVEEPSEEIRLGLVNLTNAAIVASGAMCEPFAEEIAAIVHASMRDQFHDVKKAACAVAGALVSSGASHAALTRHAPKMVNAILPDLQHRHSQVRTACLVAVDALFDLVSCEEVSETLAPGVRTLCSDRTPSVRSAFHVACARWISFVPGVQVRADEKDGDGGVIDDVNGDEVLAMEVDPATLPEGCGLPHARSLLPFLLAGVADPVEANGVKALALVEAVGAANDAALGVSERETTGRRMRRVHQRRRRRCRRRSRGGRPRRPGGSCARCSRRSRAGRWRTCVSGRAARGTPAPGSSGRYSSSRSRRRRSISGT